MKRFPVFLLLILLSTGLKAENFDSIYHKASELYQKGDYYNAAAKYEKIIKSGYESPELYFNLGNACFKMNKIPDAILYFERARRLAPEDEDINFNLKIANLKIIDKFETVPKLFFIEWYEQIRDSFSSHSWSVFAIILAWITFVALAGFILFWQPVVRRVLFTIAVLSFLLAILFEIFANQKFHFELARDQAIIFSPSVYVKSSPDEKSTDLFILHEGTKVKLLDTVGEWKKIRLANGSVGWLPEKSFEVI